MVSVALAPPIEAPDAPMRVCVEGWILSFEQLEHDDVEAIDNAIYSAEDETGEDAWRFRVKHPCTRWEVRDIFMRHPRMRRRVVDRISERLHDRDIENGGRTEATEDRLRAIVSLRDEK